MRPVNLPGRPAATASIEAKIDWLMNAVDLIARYSKEPQAESIADSYKITNLPATPVRTLNVSTATLTNVGDVLGQFLADLHKRGINTGGL